MFAPGPHDEALPCWDRFYGQAAAADSRSYSMNLGLAPVTFHECRGLNVSDAAGCEMHLHAAHRGIIAGAQKRQRRASEERRASRAVASAWAGLRTLEVSCGRCSGSALLARVLRPTMHTALDPVDGNLGICRAAWGHLPNLRLAQGRADALPFARASFDVLINVEASHAYPSWSRFVRSARRVLKPRGTLVWVDLAVLQFGSPPQPLRGQHAVDAALAELRRLNFTIAHQEELLPRVVAARTAVHAAVVQGAARPTDAGFDWGGASLDFGGASKRERDATVAWLQDKTIGAGAYPLVVAIAPG